MNSPITTDHLRAIVNAFQPGLQLVQVARPGQGVASEILLLGTSRMRLVLKRYREGEDCKACKEQAVFAHIRGLDIPAPEVLAIDASRTVVPFAWSLTECLLGEAWSGVMDGLDLEQNRRLYRELGDCVGRMHASTFDQFGDLGQAERGLAVQPADQLDLTPSGVVPGPYERWVEMHRDIVRSRLNLMRGSSFADLIPLVEDYVDRNEHLIKGDVRARLLHMDLHAGNILVRNGAITGILDVEEAIAGHNEYDLMRTELAHFRNAPPEYEATFLAAYQQHVPLDDGIEERKPFYEVSRTLAWIQSLVLNGSSYPPDALERHRQVARETLKALLR